MYNNFEFLAKVKITYVDCIFVEGNVNIRVAQLIYLKRTGKYSCSYSPLTTWWGMNLTSSFNLQDNESILHIVNS